MSHPNRISNGDFSGDLANWEASGATFVANQGNLELGAAYLSAAGHYIRQNFAIAVGRLYMVEVAVKGAGSGSLTLTIADSAGNTVYTASVTVTTSWTTSSTRVGLAWGNYTLTLTYNGVAVYVDDVSIAWVIKTRTELATEVHERLGNLATTDVTYTTAASGSDTEGSYTEAVDAGLRAVSAIDKAGRTDVRYLTEDNVDACVDEIERYMLHKLHRYYSLVTDYTIGPRTERLSQKRDAIERLLGLAVGGRSAAAGRSVQTRKLIHQG